MRTIIPVFFILSLLISCRFIEERGWFKKDVDTLEAYYARLDSVRIADSIRQVNEERILEQARLDSIRAAEQAKAERLARFKYHIIVGSFKTPEYADRYSEYYSGMGYETEILFNEYQFHVVSAKALDDLNEALRQLENFRDTVELEAWLFINQ